LLGDAGFEAQIRDFWTDPETKYNDFKIIAIFSAKIIAKKKSDMKGFK